ncbi:MAG: M14 family zinc carboxypeptidase, partial [candidate division WOR-3 bacterium]
MMRIRSLRFHLKPLVILSLLFLAAARLGSQPGAAQSGSLAQSGYYNYPSMVARLKQLEMDHPAIAQAVNLNPMLGTPMTVEGRALWALKISDNATKDEDEPAVIVDGQHHARELMTPHAVLDIAEQLLD